MACSPARCPRTDLTTEHSPTRAPGNSSANDAGLLRTCYVVVEPAFSDPYAVWITRSPDSSEAAVFVEIFNEEAKATNTQSQKIFSSPVDARMATRAATLCDKAYPLLARSCATLGRDGVWYYLARQIRNGEYNFVSFWSPTPGTAGNAVVQFAEALRDYAIVPIPFKREQWRHVQDTESKLEQALAEGS